MALGLVIAALAAPIIPLGIITLELADLVSSSPAAALRVSAGDLDPCELLRSWLSSTVSAFKSNGHAAAVLLIC